jgi:hypothetical protein
MPGISARSLLREWPSLGIPQHRGPAGPTAAPQIHENVNAVSSGPLTDRAIMGGAQLGIANAAPVVRSANGVCLPCVPDATGLG